MGSNAQTFDDLDAIRRKLHKARVQLDRLKKKPDANQTAVDAAEENVKILKKQRDDLYTGIGRRKKKARTERTEEEIVKCPICLDNIYPYEQIRTSFCYPVPHKIHRNCWSSQTRTQRLRCSVCRQPEVTSLEAVVLYGSFPTGHRSFDPDAFLRAPTLEWYNHAGVGIIRSFVREEISRHVFMRFVCHPYAPLERRQACENAFDRLRGSALEQL